MASRREREERAERDARTVAALLVQARRGLRRGANFAARWTDGRDLSDDLMAIVARIDGALLDAGED
jgi:hypothetical protein